MIGMVKSQVIIIQMVGPKIKFQNWHKNIGTKRKRRPRNRWMTNVEEDLIQMKIRNWKVIAANRTELRK